MYELCRSVRFAANHTSPEQGKLPPHHSTNGPVDFSGENGYAGVPALTGLGRFEQFDVRCVGPLDPTLNYLVDIKVVDRAVRRMVVPIVTDAFRASASSAVSPPEILAKAAAALALELNAPGGARLASLRWHLTPFQSLEFIMNPPTASPTALFRQKFEFAASHRLHVPTLTPEENRRAFGKCNHPNGHGHNYIFEPCVEIPIAAAPSSLSVHALERLCKEVILDRYDHTYLNIDTPEFDAARGGVVPSVENIARIFFERLAPKIAETGGGTLARMTVWESERTAASYPA
jgi:6-pyruvoyltetrahydropterin/6-carboxytetrahydropterin synthase